MGISPCWCSLSLHPWRQTCPHIHFWTWSLLLSPERDWQVHWRRGHCEMWMGGILSSSSWLRASCILPVHEKEWNTYHYWREWSNNFPHQKVRYLWEAYANEKNLEDYVERPREFRSKNDWSYSGEEIAFCFDGNKRLIRVNLVWERDNVSEPLDNLCRHLRIWIPKQLDILLDRKKVRHLPLLRLESYHKAHESGA